MKRIIVLATAMLAAQTVVAQDVILTREAEEIEASIVEISDTEIRYRRYSQPDGPLRAIATKDVFRIKYANGETEVFNIVETSAGNVADAVGAVYKVGDVYNENGLFGIVVHVDATGCHGLIMHPDYIHREWCIGRLCDVEVGADNKEDGMVNMVAVERYIAANGLDSSDFPAFEECIILGEGWYIPAIKEVEYIVMAANNGNLNEWDKYALEDFDVILKSIGGKKLNLLFNELVSSTEVREYMECYQYQTITVGWGLFASTLDTRIKKERTTKNMIEYYRAVHKF